jgi:predicted O-methyltransferase YrrM
MENELPYPEHGKYEWLPILYDMIGELKPKKIIEFGPGSGYTTIAMAKALQKNNIEGHINSYDIWDDSFWGKQQTTQAEYGAWGVDSYITLENLDFFEWIKDPVDFDFMYFDINNTSEKLITLYNAVKSQIDNGSVIFFEGGSKVRDQAGHVGGNMYDIKEEIGYKILTGNVKYSASTIYNTEMYNLDFS